MRYMTDYEILRDFRQASETAKPYMPRILAEQNLCRPEEIAALLERYGETVPPPAAGRAREDREQREAQYLALYRRGLTDREMSDRLDEYDWNIRYWRKRRGLPPNRKKRKSS